MQKEIREVVLIKVLIIGKYSFMMNHLILRLNREKCDIYTITGKYSKEKSKKLPAHTIFEFEADSMAVNYIMQCVRPDVVVFMGAWEDSYNWEDNMTCSGYIADLTNALIWSKTNMVKRFVYLSSMEVYEGNYEDDIREDIEPVTSCFRSKTIHNGECICKDFQDKDMHTVVLRFPIVYGPMHFEYEKLNMIAGMCFDAEKYGYITASSYASYMTVYVSDAVDAVYKTITAKTYKQDIYHIRGDRRINDKEICELIKNAMAAPVKVVGENNSQMSVCPNGDAFEQEFFYSPHIKLETGIERTVAVVKKNYKQLSEKDLEEQEAEKREQREKVKNIFNIIISNGKKILENLALFSAAFLITSQSNSVSMFESVDFMIIYLLLISLNLGVGQSVFAALLATVGNVFINMQNESIGFSEALFQYKVILQFLFYFITTIMISYKTLRKNAGLKEKEEQLEELQQEYELIYDMNKTNIEVKRVFEERLLNYGDSIGKIYNIVSELEILDPEKIEVASLGVVRKIMNVKDVCIYKIGGEDYYHLIDATTEDARIMKRSIKLGDYEQMKQTLFMGDIFINHRIGDELPRMAAPIFFEENMIYIIMLFNMEFENLNTYQKNLFLVLSKLITSSLKKGYQYEEAQRKQNYYDNTDILIPDVFNEKVSEKLDNVSKEKADYTLIQVDTENLSMHEMSEKLRLLLRDGDKIGKIKDSDICLHILVHANSSEAVFVINRLNKNGIKCRVV